MAVSFLKNDNPISFQGRSLSSGQGLKDGNNLCSLLRERKDNATSLPSLDQVRQSMAVGDRQSSSVVRYRDGLLPM
jgi:hypothetical protein